MDTTYLFLQHYWWFLVSLLGALLVFLLFVQGGQSLLYTVGRTPQERNLIVNALGHKWEVTFTTLVTFGGAFFASFPLFYSTSFGGAFYVWMLILLVFVIQAVAYEFRRKPSNFLGERTYNAFLQINGVFGALLLGVAVATLFTGAPFTVHRAQLEQYEGWSTISQWSTAWYGLDALADPRNLLLGLAVLFLSRTLGLLYFMNAIGTESVTTRARRLLRWNAGLFLLFFLTFAGLLLGATGATENPQTGEIALEPYKYLHNLMALPMVAVLLLGGVVAVLWGLGVGLFRGSRNGFWWSGAGTVAVVLALLLLAGYNHTAYYRSTVDLQSSLTIANSSSSKFTLSVMAWVSLFIPVVVFYLGYVWRAMNRSRLNEEELEQESDHSY